MCASRRKYLEAKGITLQCKRYDRMRASRRKYLEAKGSVMPLIKVLIENMHHEHRST
jgi:hypothetical protein